MEHLSAAAKKAGQDAENEARWHIDRTFHKSRNWRVFHDVLLADSRSDSWCQIDHLLLGRLGYFIVIETKSAVNGMALDEPTGAWKVRIRNGWKPVPSPVEQNARHIEVLGDFLKSRNLMPRRLMIPLPAKFHSCILVQPGVSLPSVYRGAHLVQRDHFGRFIDDFIQKMPDSDVLRIMSNEEMSSIAGQIELESADNKRISGLTRDHCEPSPPRNTVIDHEAREELPSPDLKYAPPEMRAAAIEEASVTFTPSSASNKADLISSQKCTKCKTALTHKEAAFCRYNFARLGRRFLCRKCQPRIFISPQPRQQQ